MSKIFPKKNRKLCRVFHLLCRSKALAATLSFTSSRFLFSVWVLCRFLWFCCNRKLWILILGFLSAIVAYAVLAGFNSPAGVVAGFVIFGLYSAMTDGVQRALASKLAAAEKLATGQGFLNAAIGISSLLAGLAGGAIWTFWGSAAAFVYGIALMSIGLLTFVNTPQRIV